jgi:hypothetical protein
MVLVSFNISVMSPLDMALGLIAQSAGRGPSSICRRGD